MSILATANNQSQENGMKGILLMFERKTKNPEYSGKNAN